MKEKNCLNLYHRCNLESLEIMLSSAGVGGCKPEVDKSIPYSKPKYTNYFPFIPPPAGNVINLSGWW